MVIQRIHEPDEPGFDLLIQIFESSFPASERKSVAALRIMIQSPDYRFHSAWIGDCLVAFSICALLNSVDAALLEYMAVSPDHRGKGIGKALFMHTASIREIAGRHLLIEVDSGRNSGGLPQAESIRRKMFYRHLGCTEIEGLAYKMPPVSTTEPPPMEMLHYCRSSSASVPKSVLRAWLEACYQQVYGIPTPDPRIGEMLGRLPSTIKLV